MTASITPEEIKEIRTRYGLSQKSFALLLGIGPASIVRYEQGAKPTKANANLIRAARNPRFMQECLEADGEQIPKSQRSHAERVIYDYISLNPEEDDLMHEGLDALGVPPTMSMDEMYYYTLQQEILNEQAANLLGEIMRLMLDSERFQGDKGSLEVLLVQLFDVKRQIISDRSDDDVFLEQIRGYLMYMRSYVERLCAMEREARHG